MRILTCRFLLVRTAALALLTGVYLGIYGLPRLSGDAAADDAPPAAVAPVAETEAEPADEALSRMADATTLQLAILNLDGDSPILPAATYRLDHTLELDLDSPGFTALAGNGRVRIEMHGPGPAIRLVGTHGGTAAPQTVQPGVWERQRMPLIDGIEIVGRHPEACGIEIKGTMQPTISRVAIRDCLHGIHITSRNRNVQISDSHIYNNRGCGIYLDGVNLHQINIVGCHISYNRQGGVVVRKSEIRNLQIGTCDIEANMSKEGEPAANILFDCREGSMREGAVTGCTIQHDHDAPGSANIRFIGASAEDPRKVGNFAIANNVFSDVQINIHLQHARGVTITGNTFWEGFQHDLLVEGSEEIVVGPNLFDHNPDYDQYIKETTRNGLVFRDSRRCTLSGFHVNGTRETAAAVALQRCRWFNVTGLSIFDSDGVGLLLEDCEHCHVAACMIHDSRRDNLTPIQVQGGNDNIVSHPATAPDGDR